jgi:hypothetical protein
VFRVHQPRSGTTIIPTEYGDRRSDFHSAVQPVTRLAAARQNRAVVVAVGMCGGGGSSSSAAAAAERMVVVVVVVPQREVGHVPMQLRRPMHIPFR